MTDAGTGSAGAAPATVLVSDWGTGARALLSAAVFLGVSLAMGALAVRRGDRPFATDRWWSRIRRWERDGRTWERLGVDRWKDALPEAGAWIRGGRSKRSLTGRSTPHLLSLATETRRAEWVHWMILASTSVHPLWTADPVALAVVAVVGLALSVPFIITQRYNRARLTRTLARRRH